MGGADAAGCLRVGVRGKRKRCMKEEFFDALGEADKGFSGSGTGRTRQSRQTLIRRMRTQVCLRSCVNTNM